MTSVSVTLWVCVTKIDSRSVLTLLLTGGNILSVHAVLRLPASSASHALRWRSLSLIRLQKRVSSFAQDEQRKKSLMGWSFLACHPPLHTSHYLRISPLLRAIPAHWTGAFSCCQSVRTEEEELPLRIAGKRATEAPLLSLLVRKELTPGGGEGGKH